MILNNKIGILGHGEIGSSLAKFYDKPLIKDLDRDDGLIGVDVLHICIPWSTKFVDIVAEEIKKIKPKLTIIHSTVNAGETKAIIANLPVELRTVVHSPVRGMHPNLYEGIKHFVKYIGAEDEVSAKLAEDHFHSLGVATKTFYPSATTELGKILDTTYYGLMIAWHGEMKKLTDKFGVNFDEAVSHFNTTYNEGYKKLDKHHVVRPVLSAPDEYIGGHCIIPNAKLVGQHIDSKAIELILEYEKKDKNQHKIN